MWMHVYSGSNDETKNNNSSNILMGHLTDVSQERNSKISIKIEIQIFNSRKIDYIW